MSLGKVQEGRHVGAQRSQGQKQQSSQMLSPVRAPKRCWPAKPPQPWQLGKCPNHAEVRSMSPTDAAILLAAAGLVG